MSEDRYSKSEYFATCAKGLEGIVADELKQLGIQNVRPLASGVSFWATIHQVCKALLWLRCASRVLLVLGRVPADDADELYKGCSEIPWEEHIPAGKTFAVSSKGMNDNIRNTQFTALKVKDAICDRLLSVIGSRPDVDPKNPDIPVRVNLHKSKATIYLDLCGDPLHMRGYRDASRQVSAPLKETLAAAVLITGDWQKIASEGGCLVDPFCGSGTIAIEGAMIAADIAPGIMRQNWAVKNWLQYDDEIFCGLLDEADSRAEAGLAAEHFPTIVAGDIDPEAIEAAMACAKRAGVGNLIRIETSDAAALDLSGLPERGLVATNPPYGERISSVSQLPSLMAVLRNISCSDGRRWDTSVIVSSPETDAMLGMKVSDVVETFNGPIEASIRHYVAGAEANFDPTIADEFANRLSKMAKRRAKWARKNGVTCYRVYDADLPDFSMSIDLYQGAGADSTKKWVQVCEYAPPKTVDPELARTRVIAALDVVRQQFDVDSSDVYFKQRKKSRGGSQYGATMSSSEELDDQKRIIFEGGHLFRVSMGTRLDTGIFLDGRLVREMIQANSHGKRFLNLFAYTGTASVYAAAGGAVSTHTVDMSQTYLDWARDNMSLNCFDGAEHTYERADAITWVNDVRHSRTRYDLVYIDPPTFSNSKKMRTGSWDVQRDHAELLIDVSRILSPDGVAIFCCNLNNFKPDIETLAKAHVGLADISAKTIPEDFERNSKIHHCYVMRHLN